MVLIHGTSKNNYKLGLKAKNKSIWNCSAYDKYMYFWDLRKIQEYDELEKNLKYTIEQALQSAIVQASINKEKILTIVIKKINDTNIKYIEDDFSCPDMSYASCIHSDNLNELEAIIINIKNPLDETFRLFILLSLLNNDYVNKDVINEKDLIILKQLKDIESYKIWNIMQEEIDKTIDKTTEKLHKKIKKLLKGGV